MSAPPGPSSPLYFECDIGPYHWPPKEGSGRVVIKVKTAIETETQKPNGKDPVKTKVKGKKPAELSLEFTWSRAAEEEGNAIRLALDPMGANSGQAFDLRNPEANARGVDHVMIEQASELSITGDMYSFTLTGKGWKEPQKATVGGTKTPTTAVPGNIHMGKLSNLGFGPQQAVDIPLGEIQPPGMNGLNKPNAEP